MKSKFKVGDRFAYIASGNTGVITNVYPTSGTVGVHYDHGKDNLAGVSDGEDHRLAENILRFASPGEITISGNVIGTQTSTYGSDDPLPSNTALEVARANELTETRTNQLLNELYHDRSRLEKLVENAAELTQEAAEAVQALLNKDYSDEDEQMTQELVSVTVVGAKLAQFSEANS